MVANITNAPLIKCDMDVDSLNELALAVINDNDTYLEEGFVDSMREMAFMFEKKAKSTSATNQSLEELRKKTGLIEVLMYYIQNKKMNLMTPEDKTTFSSLEARYAKTIPKVRDGITLGKVDKTMRKETQSLLADTHALLDKLSKNNDVNKLNEMSLNIFKEGKEFNVRSAKKVSAMISNKQLTTMNEDFSNYLKKTYSLYENKQLRPRTKSQDAVASKKMGLIEVANHFMRNSKKENMSVADKKILTSLEERYKESVPTSRAKIKAKQSLSEKDNSVINNLLKDVNSFFSELD